MDHKGIQKLNSLPFSLLIQFPLILLVVSISLPRVYRVQMIHFACEWIRICLSILIIIRISDVILDLMILDWARYILHLMTFLFTMMDSFLERVIVLLFLIVPFFPVALHLLLLFLNLLEVVRTWSVLSMTQVYQQPQHFSVSVRKDLQWR